MLRLDSEMYRADVEIDRGDMYHDLRNVLGVRKAHIM